jgi:hypothetical protein
MKNNLIRIKFKNRLNKGASNDYDNFECWQLSEAFNKEQRDWVRNQIHGKNLEKEGDEQSKMRIDDLQILLSRVPLKGINKGSYFETTILPRNYGYFKRISIHGYSKDCKKPQKIGVTLVEEANVDQYLMDEIRSPSFEWRETFATLIGNRIKIYTNNEFTVVEPELIYYRLPKSISFIDCVDTEGNVIPESECEFKDDIAELIAERAAATLASDIESMNQAVRLRDSSDKNN